MSTPRYIYYVVSLLLLVLRLGVFVGARSFRQPPISSAAIVKDARIISWQYDPETVHSTSTFTLLFNLAFSNHPSSKIRLSLEPNHDLLRNAIVEYIDHNGEVVQTEPIIRHEHKIYKGEAYVRDEQTKQWQYCGWARITVLQDGSEPLFEGVFVKDEDVHHIKLLSKYKMQREPGDVDIDFEDSDGIMVVYRDSDRYLSQATLLQRSIGGILSVEDANTSACAHDRLEFNMQPVKHSSGFGFDFFNRLTRRQSDTGGGTSSGSRAQLQSTIGDTDGCPKIRQIALVAAAADCSYVTQNGNSTSTRSNIISIFNSASAVYEQQLNISLGLSNIVMSDAACPSTPPTSAKWNVACSTSFSMDDDLSTFSQWRGSRGSDGVALWTLLTGCSSGAEVGVAWLGTLCQYNALTQGAQTVSGTNVVSATQSEWQVLAHEIGHGFGAYHDCTSQLCATTQTCCPLSSTVCDANQQYIMNPTTMDATNRFSPCTIGNICSSFASKTVSTTCLSSNNNVTLITAGECGNGIVEVGEECDCGGVQGCAGDPCCDPTTCKYTTGSVCDDSNESCCQNCQFAPSTKVCRTSTNPICDPQETCTGNSSSCPSDHAVADGTSCGSGLQCASGQCTSRNLQCQQTVNGSTGSCDDTSCMLSCTSNEGANTCLLVQQNYVDGTPCGFGLSGRCQNGQCEGESTGAAIKDWIEQNKTLVIVIASVLGSLFLLCLSSCLYRGVALRKKGGRFLGKNRQLPFPPAQRSFPRAQPPRRPSMVYYPQGPPSYGPPPPDMTYTRSQAPPYSPPYAPPPARYNPGNEGRLQQPGEEWVQGPDGAFYPPNQVPRNQPARPRTIAGRWAQIRDYWEN